MTNSNEVKKSIIRSKFLVNIAIPLIISIVVFYHQDIISTIGYFSSEILMDISQRFGYLYHEELSSLLIKTDETSIILFAILITISMTSFIITIRYFDRFIRYRNNQKYISRKNKLHLGSLSNHRKYKNYIVRLYSIFIIVYLIVLCVVYSIHSIQKEIVYTYQEQILALRPYLDEKQIDTFNSRWIQMRTQEDFDSIQGDISKSLKLHNINLK